MRSCVTLQKPEHLSRKFTMCHCRDSRVSVLNEKQFETNSGSPRPAVFPTDQSNAAGNTRPAQTRRPDSIGTSLESTLPHLPNHRKTSTGTADCQRRDIQAIRCEDRQGRQAEGPARRRDTMPARARPSNWTLSALGEVRKGKTRGQVFSGGS